MKITFEDTSMISGRPGVDVTFKPDPVGSRGEDEPELYERIAAEEAVDLPDGAGFIGGGKGAIQWHVNEANYQSAEAFAKHLQQRVTDALDAYAQFEKFHRVRFAIHEEEARVTEEARVKS